MHPDRMSALIGFRNQVGILRGLVRDKEGRLYAVLIKHIQELFRQIGLFVPLLSIFQSVTYGLTALTERGSARTSSERPAGLFGS